MKHYYFRSHSFDAPRQDRKPQRKSGGITAPGLPSRGAQGVRSHHKVNEEKILTHRRYGFCDGELDKFMND